MKETQGMRANTLAKTTVTLALVGAAALVLVPAVQAASTADIHKVLLTDSGWSHVSTDDSDGLQVYKKHISSLGVDAFMGKKTLNPGVDDDTLFKLISDVDNHETFSTTLHESTELGGGDYYQVVKAPKMLPVSARYWFNHAASYRDVGGVSGHLRRTWSTIDSATYATELGHVTSTYADAIEIAFTYGMWEIVPNDTGPSTLLYRTVSNPGGDIPAWVMSSLTGRTLPDNMRTFENAALKASQ
jgi:hypothetical protein